MKGKLRLDVVGQKPGTHSKQSMNPDLSDHTLLAEHSILMKPMHNEVKPF